MAFEDFSKAISLDNKDGASYLSRGLGYAQQGSFSKAEEDFNQAAALAAEQGNRELLGEIDKYRQALNDARKQSTQK